MHHDLYRYALAASLSEVPKMPFKLNRVPPKTIPGFHWGCKPPLQKETLPANNRQGLHERRKGAPRYRRPQRAAHTTEVL